MKSYQSFFFLILASFLLWQPIGRLRADDNRKASYICEQFFRRECANNKEHLAFWNSHEKFPSFGIGHFIWLVEDQNVDFEDQFVQVLVFIKTQGVQLPSWLKLQKTSQWRSKKEFDADKRLGELRQFLWQTRELQAHYIMNRFALQLKKIIQCHPNLKNHIKILSQTPEGYFAMLDYCHFKGSGLSNKERYDHEGWGLTQVLQSMSRWPKKALPDFVRSAEKVLCRRVTLKNEEKCFLPGWINRLRSYLDPAYESTFSKKK
jgi:hypothetical protein